MRVCSNNHGFFSVLIMTIVFFFFFQNGERLYIGAPGSWYWQGKILLSLTTILNECSECDTSLDLCIMKKCIGFGSVIRTIKILLYCRYYFLLFVTITGQVYSIAKSINGNIPFVPPRLENFGVLAGIMNLQATLTYNTPPAARP